MSAHVPEATRQQFAHQAPYFPGTSWMVDGCPAYIDASGRAWWVGDLFPMPIAWWNDGRRHTAEPITAQPVDSPLTTHVDLGAVWIERDDQQVRVDASDVIELVRSLLIHLAALEDAR